MTDSIEDLLKRAARAVSQRQNWDNLLRDAYAFAAPDLDTALQGYGVAGARRHAKVYDATAIQAVIDAAAMTHMKLTPPHTRFFQIAWAPGVHDRAPMLDDLTDKLFQHLDASAFHSVIELAYQQAQISQACLVMNEAHPQSLSAFDIGVVPAAEIYPEPAWRAQERTIWRIRELPLSLVKERWRPSAKLLEQFAGKPEQEAAVKIHEGALWLADERAFRYVVIAGEGDRAELLEDQRQKTSPFIVGGYSAAPGEALPRGPVLSVLGDIKTANLVVELVLKNASIAVSGIWQADDDGVINPSTIRLVPGAVIPKAVGSQGLTPLAAPGRFDVAEIQLQRLQTVIRDAIMRREMPRMDKSHITAEAVSREAIEVELLRMPGLLVLWQTIVVPLLKRGADILQRRNELPPELVAGTYERAIEIHPVAPWLQAQALSEITQEAQALQTAALVAPEKLPMVADLAGWQRTVLERMGFPLDLIRDPQEVAEAEAAAQQQAEAAAIAESAGRAAPALKLMAGGE